MEVSVGMRVPVPVDSRSSEGGVAPLGLVEAWYASQPQPRLYTLVAEFDHPVPNLTTDRLIIAARTVASRHALLRASLIEARSDTRAPSGMFACVNCFTPRAAPQAPKYLVRSAVEFARLVLPVQTLHEPRPWPEVFAEVANEAWREMDSGESPLALLWRLIALPPAADSDLIPGRSVGGALMLVVHHALCDGLSAAAVLAELVGEVAGRAAGLEPEPVEEVLENALDVRPLVVDVARSLLETTLDDSAFLGPRELPAPLPRRPVPALRGASLPRLATPPPLVFRRPAAPLVARCRASGLTVHAALSAAALFAVAAVARAKEPPLIATLSTPVSLRKTANVPSRAVGTFICGARTRHVIRPATRFGALAEAVRAGVKADVPRATREIGLLKMVPDLPAFAFRRCEQAGPALRTATLEVSDLGALPFPALPATLRFAQASHVDGPLYSVSVCTTGPADDDGALLALSVGYVEPAAEGTTARRFCGALLRCLDTFVSAPASTDFTLAELLSLWYPEAPAPWRTPPDPDAVLAAAREARELRSASQYVVGCGAACSGTVEAEIA